MPSNHFHIRTADEVVDTSVDIEVDVGTAADVEAVMRKYDRESNTRTWEGTPGIIVRVIMVIFSLYCIWSTLFSVAAIEKAPHRVHRLRHHHGLYDLPRLGSTMSATTIFRGLTMYL